MAPEADILKRKQRDCFTAPGGWGPAAGRREVAPCFLTLPLPGRPGLPQPSCRAHSTVRASASPHSTGCVLKNSGEGERGRPGDPCRWAAVWKANAAGHFSGAPRMHPWQRRQGPTPGHSEGAQRPGGGPRGRLLGRRPAPARGCSWAPQTRFCRLSAGSAAPSLTGSLHLQTAEGQRETVLVASASWLFVLAPGKDQNNS